MRRRQRAFAPSCERSRAGDVPGRKLTNMGWSEGEGDAPLSGIRVIDFGQYVAGPLVGTLLGDQGADVIHVDPPSGPRLDLPANAVLFRGRRTLRLDLTDANDLAVARDLVASADVLIENFRPGV